MTEITWFISAQQKVHSHYVYHHSFIISELMFCILASWIATIIPSGKFACNFSHKAGFLSSLLVFFFLHNLHKYFAISVLLRVHLFFFLTFEFVIYFPSQPAALITNIRIGKIRDYILYELVVSLFVNITFWPKQLQQDHFCFRPSAYCKMLDVIFDSARKKIGVGKIHACLQV